MATSDSPEHPGIDQADTHFRPQNAPASISKYCAHMHVRATQVAVTVAPLRVVRGIERAREWTVRWPSAIEVARTMGLSTSTVVGHLKRLRRIGVIADATRIVREPTGVLLTKSNGGWGL